MKITYDFERGSHWDTLTVRTNQGLNISLFFSGGDFEFLDLTDDGFEVMHDSDLMSCLAVAIDDKMVYLCELVADASSAYPSIVAEYVQEEADEQRMADELSSPEHTGRI